MGTHARRAAFVNPERWDLTPAISIVAERGLITGRFQSQKSASAGL